MSPNQSTISIIDDEIISGGKTLDLSGNPKATLLPSQIAQGESNKKWLRNHPPNLGRIGQLAEELRCAARSVMSDMHRTPGGDAFEYRGSTSAVDDLIDKLNALEHFQAGWVK